MMQPSFFCCPRTFLPALFLCLFFGSFASQTNAAGSSEKAIPLASTASPYSAAVFPASAPAAGDNSKNIFSYALEGGFARISFANIQENSAPALPPSAQRKQTLYGLIALDLKPGWKTYWRNPGTSGFPPKIEINGGAKAEILFPVPQLFEYDKEWVYGYKNRVLMPFKILLPQTQIQNIYNGSVTLGICEDLCMPQTFLFQFSLEQADDAAEQAAITAALQALPKPADNSFQISNVTSAKNSLEFTLHYPRTSQLPQIFLDGGVIQTGQAHPIESAAHRSPKAENFNTTGTQQQLYQADILFGTVSGNAALHYTIAFPDGKAVSGTANISKAQP